MTYENIRFERQDDLAIITLARPERLNALSVALLQDLIHAVDTIRDEGTARALLIQAEGRGFCSGADLSAPPHAQHPNLHAEVDYGARIEAYYNPLILRLFALPMPIVCAVNGAAAGAGCSLALTADFVVAAQNAYFLQAFVNIGLVPDAGATWMLTRAVGRARATEMMMLGERLDAQTAKDWGLIYQVVAPDALPETARTLATRLSRGPTSAYASVRKTIRAALESSLAETLVMERDNQRKAGKTQDFKEGKTAFVERRPPKFTGG